MKHITTDLGSCCEGQEKLTPLPIANRPGLNQLLYRLGTQASFLKTMLGRLSDHYLKAPLAELDEQGQPKTGRIYPLQGLKTRLPEDAAIALLDAWATVADVLTFYQERIANEGFLRTATEHRSIQELARLVGYKPRPGVSSSVFLAYTLDENLKDEVIIPKGARSQSIPGPGELPQSFETSEDLKARAKWNNLKPRMTRPQTKETILKGDDKNVRLYLKGISTNLKPNDPLLINFSDNNQKVNPKVFHVKEVIPDAVLDRTIVIMQEESEVVPSAKVTELNIQSLLGALTLPPSVQSPNSLRLERSLNTLFAGGVPGLSLSGGETNYKALKALSPILSETLSLAASNAQVTAKNPIKVYAFRVTASPFGHNAPKRILKLNSQGKIIKTGEWPIIEWPQKEGVTEPIKHEGTNTIYLNASYEKILPDTWVIIDTTNLLPKENEPQVEPAKPPILITKTKKVQTNISRAEYGITGHTTRLELEEPWLTIEVNYDMRNEERQQTLADKDFRVIRGTVVYAQSQELELAEEPMEELIGSDTDDLIELDGFYHGLESGRWVIVSGERNIPGTCGVKFSELAMLAVVTQDVQKELPSARSLEGLTSHEAPPSPKLLLGDKTHTFIKIAKKLQYSFKRETVTIYGNVVKATHGETRQEVLGSGDGAKALQSFTLKQQPLTFLSASNPSGVDSTLKILVNEVEWPETDSLAGLSPIDRNFMTKTDDEGKTMVIFGNGREGARLPTGLPNIKAEYRQGLGQQGNVKAGLISLLMSRPLGVKEVINPLSAFGGADKESRDQARLNAPLAVKALDRLVSVQDYQDFARTYGGIGKAYARELSNGHGQGQLVHVTIAGSEDIQIDETSDLFRNLRQSLLDFGDPFQPVMLAVRELVLIVLSARVRILPGYQWESVVTQLRKTLLKAFSFEQRELGQDVLLSEMISLMMGVPGIAYVDVDLLRGIPEKIPDQQNPGQRRLLTPDEISGKVSQPLKDEGDHKEPVSRIRVNLSDFEDGLMRPAQLAILMPDVPETLILNQINYSFHGH